MKIGSFVAKTAFILGLSPCYIASAALTEDDIIKAGLEDPVYKTQASAKISTAEAILDSSGHWENPSIQYGQESVDVPGGSSKETSIWLEQRINIAGAKALEIEAAQSNLNVAQAQVRLSEQLKKKVLRESFYSALAATRKLYAINAQQSQLEKVASIIEKRVNKGDASRFDLLRIEKQATLLLSEKAVQQSELSRYQQALFSKIELEPQSIIGKLLPIHEEISALDIETHPQIVELNAQKQTLLLDAETANRKRWPEITVALGYKEVDEPSFSSDGNMFSIGVDIPITNHEAGKHKAALSQANKLQADLILQKRELKAAYQTASNQYQTLTQAAAQLKNTSFNSKSSLSHLAEISYQAGELSVMELLDAYQSDLETELRFIETALLARLAFIQIQNLRGE